MKRKPKARMAIFMLLVMLGNFFMGVSTFFVEALTTGEVYNYSQNIKGYISDVEGLISGSEGDEKYLTDNAFKESVIYLSNELDDLETNLDTALTVLDAGISLSDLINDSFISKKTEYETYMSEDTTIIDLNSITDIKYTYDNEGVATEVTLLTKSEIEQAVINSHLLNINNDIISIKNNYTTLINNSIESYNGVIASINNYKDLLEEKRLEVISYKESEELLGNAPNMIVNDENISDLIIATEILLDEKKIGITIENISSRHTEILEIYNDGLSYITTFDNNNKDYIELEIPTSITALETNYSTANTCLSNWFDNIDTFKNNDYSYADDLDLNLISCFSDILVLNSSYNTLNTKITSYLERRVSDEIDLNALMSNIEIYRVYLNNEKVLSHIDNIVNSLISSDEDTIDLLSNFLDIKEVSDTTKDKIKNAKYAFYSIELIDETNYQMEENDNYLILDNVLSLISKTDFINNLDYGTNNKEIEEVTTNITNNSVLKLYDRDDNLLRNYSIIIRGDINNDGLMNNDDLLLLNENLLDNHDFTDQEKLVFDFNDDLIVNIKDLAIMNNILNNTDFNNATTNQASLSIERVDKDSLVCYDLDLETNGNVTALIFDVATSDNLIFNSIETVLDVNDIEDPTRMIYNDSISSGGIASICFNEDETKDLTTEKLIVSNIEFVLENGTSISQDALTSTLVKVIEEEVIVEENYNPQPIVNKVEEEIEEIIPLKEEKGTKTTPTDEEEPEITTKEIVWGNVIKIVIIVLLGTLIIYLLNKNDNEEKIDNTKDNKRKSNK